MKTLVVMSGCVILAGGWVAAANLFGEIHVTSRAQPVVHFPYNSSFIDPAIRVDEEAVRRDPGGALSWSLLASDYMARSRESDDLATAVKAERAAQRSLDIRKIGNAAARDKLAQALLQQHRFKDALLQCDAAVSSQTYDDQTMRLRAESLMEIGRYDAAEQTIHANPRAFQGASGEAIAARLADVYGRPEQALQLMRSAANQADQAPAMPSDAIAWFHTRVAMQLAKMGRHVESRKEFLTALALYPRDYKSMAGLARVAYQDRRWQETIDWGLRCDTIAQMADVRALVGDAYAKLGDVNKAEQQYARVAELVGRPSGMNDGMHEVAPAAGAHGHRLDRQYAIFCADHGRDPEGAYAAAIRDFEGRQDVYAFDTLAWVCLKTGRRDEAIKAINKALARGTKDPTLFFHASEIYAAAGKRQTADQYREMAAAIDPTALG